jgi:hypothetical protein
MSWKSFVCIVIGYRVDNPGLGFNFQKGQQIFLFFIVSKLTMGPSGLLYHPQWGVLSLKVKHLGSESGHSSPSSFEIKMK